MASMRLLWVVLFLIACSPAAPARVAPMVTAPRPSPPAPIVAPAPTACGWNVGDTCGPDEICVIGEGGAPRPPVGTCIAVPGACLQARNCGCLGAALCSG